MHIADLLIFFGATGVSGFIFMFLSEIYLSSKSRKEIKKMNESRDQQIHSLLQDLNALRDKPTNENFTSKR